MLNAPQATYHKYREDVIVNFMRKIWQIGVLREGDLVKGETEREKMILLPANKLYEGLDAMAADLREWGKDYIEQRLQGVSLENQNLKHRLYLLERYAMLNEQHKSTEQTSMARRIDVAVKDQCYALLFKIDSLERKLLASQKELVEMERTVRERLKIEFEDLVKDLSTQVLDCLYVFVCLLACENFVHVLLLWTCGTHVCACVRENGVLIE